MREVHCPHCNATNRRPKCGNCQKEVADPAAIEFAWKLYEQRRYLRYIGIAFLIMAVAIVLWRPWETFYFFSPTNVAECREQAARTARSNDAMRVLIRCCNGPRPEPLARGGGCPRMMTRRGPGWSGPRHQVMENSHGSLCRN